MASKKLESIEGCIDDQLSTAETESDILRTKAWLEGWICGVTDNVLHPKFGRFKDPCISYLLKVTDGKLFAITKDKVLKEFRELSLPDQRKILGQLKRDLEDE